MKVFISLQLNHKRPRISARRNFVEESTCKQRGLFDRQNYIEKSKWKQSGFFDHRSYAEKRTWKRLGFFDQRNYIEKVCRNDVEIRRNLVFDISIYCGYNGNAHWAACWILSKALNISSAAAWVAPDLLKALAVLWDTTVRRFAFDQEDLKAWWKLKNATFSWWSTSLLTKIWYLIFWENRGMQ